MVLSPELAAAMLLFVIPLDRRVEVRVVGGGRTGRARATRDRWVTEQRDSATLDPVD